MGHVVQLGYVGIVTRDVAAWRRFAGEVVGLEVMPDGDDANTYLRMDEYHHRLVVHPGPADDVAYLGWQLPDAGRLAQAVRRVESLGTEIVRAPPEVVQARRVIDLYAFDDPVSGLRMELYYGPDVLFVPPFRSPQPVSGFLAGERGVGHVALHVADVHGAARFYEESLGLRVSDWVREKETGFEAVFFHCNRRHHSLALVAEDSARRQVHHVLLEMLDLDDVGMAYDRCRAQGLVAAGFGRHLNDRMFSFYARVPGGWYVELGWGAQEIDPQTWQVRQFCPATSDGEWGHDGFAEMGKHDDSR